MTSSDSKDDANFSSMVRESAGSSSSGSSSSDSDSGSSGSSDSASGIRGSSGSRDGGSDSDGGSVGSSSRHEVLQERAMREHLKQRLFARCAACDRGFSAVSADREAVASLIGDLMRITPEPAPTRNFFPNDNNVGGYTTEYNAQVPLVGCWQMIYTSALDVLSLAANPFTITQAIYQLLTNDGAAVNVIDVAPRLQALLPPSLVNDGSTLRLKVKIDAAARSEREVALNFKSLEVKPLRLLSNDVSFLPPLSVKLPQSLLPGGEKDQLATRGGPGFFEVLYLDEELLIIEQGAPGGIFISIRNNEPMESFL